MTAPSPEPPAAAAPAPMPPPERRRPPLRGLLILLFVVSAGMLFTIWRGVGAHALDDLAGSPWAAPALFALYVALFGLGSPGSWLLVASGFLYPPPIATLIAVTGGSLGCLVAFWIGSYLGAEARERWRLKKGFALVERTLDFPGLLALRLVPFLPHSVVNYGAGIAGAPLRAFVPATVIGIAVKAWVYSSVAHHASRSADPMREIVRFEVLGGLLLLAGISFGAKLVIDRRRRG